MLIKVDKGTIIRREQITQFEIMNDEHGFILCATLSSGNNIKLASSLIYNNIITFIQKIETDKNKDGIIDIENFKYLL